MKKYRLNICDTASVEYTEKQFKKLENVHIYQGEREPFKKLITAKKLYLHSETLKNPLIVISELENFEVINE